MVSKAHNIHFYFKANNHPVPPIIYLLKWSNEFYIAQPDIKTKIWIVHGNKFASPRGINLLLFVDFPFLEDFPSHLLSTLKYLLFYSVDMQEEKDWLICKHCSAEGTSKGSVIHMKCYNSCIWRVKTRKGSYWTLNFTKLFYFLNVVGHKWFFHGYSFI